MTQTPQYGGRGTVQQPQQFQATQGPQQMNQTGSGGAGQLPQEWRQSLGAVAQAIEVCGWCADKCIESADPNMVECIKLCEDVVEIGETVLALGPRSSRFTAELAQTFERAARMCAQECSRHTDAHCQECAAVLPGAAQTVQRLATQSGQQFAGNQSQQFSQ